MLKEPIGDYLRNWIEFGNVKGLAVILANLVANHG